MRGTGYADVPVVLQVPGNKADAVPCERLQKMVNIGLLFEYVDGHLLNEL